MNRTLLFFVAVLLLFGGSTLLWFGKNQLPTAGSSTGVDEDYQAPEKELTEFEFTDQLAQPFGTKDLQGQIWLGSFFFADCPSICVQQNTDIARLHRRFRDQGVKIVNITVAPDKDPPHKLWDYANRFDADHARWKFLTGKDIRYVRQVGIDLFGLAAADETHTSEVVLFDQQGEKQDSYNVTDPVEFAKLVSKVNELLERGKQGAVEDELQRTTENEEATSDSAPVVSEQT